MELLVNKYSRYNQRSKLNMLKNKKALVTGSSRGIGRKIVELFLANGAEVWGLCSRPSDARGELEALASEKGTAFHEICADCADAAALSETVKAALSESGGFDVLVNNAGITKDGLMMRMTEQQWDAVLTVNLKSAFNFIHACTPIMAKQRGGSIINMSSVVGVSGNAGQCNYSASKAGLIGLAKSIAKEMGPRGIRANCIAPGFIITDMTNALPEKVRQEWETKIPLRRGGTPEDVANVALFLGSDLSSYVSGQVIHCCGAMNC